MAYTVDIYRESQDDPGVWTLVVENFNAAHGVFGWQYETSGTYRFRVELYLNGELVTTKYTDWITLGRSRVLTEERAALMGADQRQDRIWLFVEDADGNPRDRSSYMTGCEIVAHRDARVTSASIRIRREHGTASLAPELDASPLNKKADGSYGPAIAIGRRFTLWVAPTAADAEPDYEDDSIILFCGRIDEHDFARSDASVAGRDIGGRLADTQITEERIYGAPSPGMPVQEIIRRILDDNAPGTPLEIPTDIDVELGVKLQEKEFLLEALRWYALLAGADLRYLWNDETGAFVLTLLQLDTIPLEPAYVFSRHEWLDVTAYSASIANIRNAASGWYTDDNNKRWYVGMSKPISDESDSSVSEEHPDGYTLTDPESIRKYGYRPMEFGLPGSSPVRTLAAFQTLQTTAVLALSEPSVDLEIKTTMFWPAGVHRIYGFEADGIRFASQRNFACVGYRHVYSKSPDPAHMEDTFETYLTLRATPSGASEEFLTRVRPSGGGGTLTPPPTSEPPAPDPTAPQLTAASAYTDAIFYDVPPASVTVEWAAVNHAIDDSISLDRRINAEPWTEDVATALDPDLGIFTDTIDGFVNRPDTDFPPVTDRVLYRVRLVNISNVTLRSRTTNSVPLHAV